MAQIMREHLILRYTRRFAKPLHLPPDVGAVGRIATRGHENRSDENTPFFKVFCEELTQLFGQEHHAALSLAGYHGAPCADGFDSDEFQLGHPYSRGAYGLQYQPKTFVSASF